MFMYVHTDIPAGSLTRNSAILKRNFISKLLLLLKNLKIKFLRRSWPWSAGKGHLFCRS